MPLPATPDEMLATTRSVRKRLAFSCDVTSDVLTECLDLALQAATGSLRQDCHFAISNDRYQCRAAGEVYKRVWLGMVSDDYLQKAAAKEPDPHARADWLKMMDSARYLAEMFYTGHLNLAEWKSGTERPVAVGNEKVLLKNSSVAEHEAEHTTHARTT